LSTLNQGVRLGGIGYGSMSDTGCLAGIRVLDLADERGELCGRLLADLGADVIRVEPPAGSATRDLPPKAGGVGTWFAWRNANKRGITLDVQTPGGADLLERLVANADVLVDPGSESGVDIEGLVARHEHLIVVSISDFGRAGPYAGWSGSDTVDFALGGSMLRFGPTDKAPLVPPSAFAYDMAGVHAALYAVMALLARGHSGRGGTLDVSVVECVANAGDWALPSLAMSRGRIPRSGASLHYPIFPCADGHVRIVIPLLPRQWEGMKDLLGRPPALEGEEWNGVPHRLGNAELANLITEYFATRTRVELAHEGQSRSVPITPVLLPHEVMENEHSRARGTFVTAEVDEGVEGIIAAGFFEVDGRRVGFRRRAPRLGEHEAAVLGEELGLDEAERRALHASGVL
jgi:crotonobetainyl-CoA:carnitine CoA-transferase CaiB-like acyl-CoA transferase